MIRTVLLCLFLATAVGAQTHKVDVQPSSGWIDTGVQLAAGDTVRITASGELQYNNSPQSNGPEGLARTFTDLLRMMPYSEAGRGALIGRIGDSAAARPFLVGTGTTVQARVAGNLFLAVNQSTVDEATGSYHVTIATEHSATPHATAQKQNVAVPAFPQSIIDAIPTRVSDPDGRPGDRVNFILIGSQEQVQAALKAAGWVTVDRTPTDAILRGLLASFSKEAYVTLPMSELRLFDRPQDFGYAQADPLRVVASRHHFRLWKTPYTLDGQTVWAGAGTHDIGFERDQRNNGITHKIDPNTDAERDYIRDSLLQSGMVVKTDYITPTNPVLTARTATGGEFKSDGRTLLVYFAAATGDVSASFGDTFCSVLKQNNPDGGTWGPCSQYIATPGRDDLALGAFSTKYAVLIVPGILSSCVPDSPAFEEGQKALKQKYGLDVSLLPVPNDSSESNARLIVQYLQAHKPANGKKYILIGYSKGTPDIQVALAQDPGLASEVAAFITVAGASGGSQVANLMPQIAEKYMTTVPLKSCQGNMADGLKSLQSAARHAFLAEHPNPVVPTYSLIAQSDQATTSKSLLATWRILASYGSAEDGQLLRDDAIAPGAKFLGAALADHFAVAMPFDKSTDATIRSGMDKTVYPRAALLESLLRFVSADLDR